MVQVITDDTLLERPRTLRLRFSKVGSLQYISHLDLMRTMTRALIRARLPLWYTQGYNPIPHLVFATPLSVGTESRCEFLDVRIVKNVDPDAVLAAANATLPQELRILEVYYPEAKFNALVYSEYEIKIVSDAITDGYLSRASELLWQKPLTVTKKTKAGIRDVDISGGIRKLELNQDGNSLQIHAVLAANSAEFLNPELLIRILKEKTGILLGDPMQEHYSILRIDDYTEDMARFR